MPHFSLIFIFSVLAIVTYSSHAENNLTEKPLDVGVVPYISARAVIANFEPLRLHLEQVLGKPVKIYTSTGFKQFYSNAQRGEYDLVISAAHIARILQTENKFNPLVKLSPAVHALIMTNSQSPLTTAHELKEKTLAVPDKLALASIVAMSWLRENGMRPGIDYKVLEVPSFSSALLAMQKGDAVAAISVPPVLMQIPKELRESTKELIDAGEFLSFIFLTHPRMASSDTVLLSKALLKFNNESNLGKQFFINTGFGSIIPLTTKDMPDLDRYAVETKRLLEELN